MRKILPVLLVLLFTYSMVLAQTENKNPAESNSKTTNVVQQIDYSESVPYKPREFKVEQKSESKKNKKEKKSKKDLQGENQIVSTVNAAQNQTINDSVISENMPIIIPVSVFDAKGNPVQHLKKSDFKIFVDDEEQEIFDFGADDKPLNIVLILDVSPSTAYEIEEFQKYASTVVKQLRPQDKVMVITFDEQTKVLAELTDDRQKADAAIKKAKFGDGTSLYEAVKYSLQKRISQINGRKFVLMLTDGVDTTSRTATYKDSLLAAEKTDALFFPIYIDTYQFMNKTMGKRGTINNQIIQQIISQQLASKGNSMSAEEEYERGRQYLTDLVQLSGGQAMTIKNLPALNKTKFENVFEAFRNQYYVSMNYADGGKINQRKQIKVRVSRPNVTVKARGSYVVGENN